jgi:drug/metabolite transporter (DMT)-like permease
MKELVSKAVAIYVAIGEIPTLWKFLVFIAKAATNPGDPQTEAMGNLMVAILQNAIIPWWIEPMQWLSPYPLLLVAFIFGVAKFGGFDG